VDCKNLRAVTHLALARTQNTGNGISGIDGDKERLQSLALQPCFLISHFSLGLHVALLLCAPSPIHLRWFCAPSLPFCAGFAQITIEFISFAYRNGTKMRAIKKNTIGANIS